MSDDSIASGEIEDALAKYRTPDDALERLGLALYGRKPTAREYLGGSDARILSDAAEMIEELRAKLDRLGGDLAPALDYLHTATPKDDTP